MADIVPEAVDADGGNSDGGNSMSMRSSDYGSDSDDNDDSDDSDGMSESDVESDDSGSETIVFTNPLCKALRAGDELTVAELILTGFDIEYMCNGFTPLFQAARFGHAKVVEVLLKNGANAAFATADRGDTCLHAAVPYGEEDPETVGRFIRVVELLLDHSPALINQISDYDASALGLAVSRGQITIARMLLERGAIVNVKDIHPAAHGTLFDATREQRPDMVELLLEHGANVTELEDECGETAIDSAIFGGDMRSVKALIAAGIDLNNKNKKGQTLLHKAAKWGEVDMVSLFLKLAKCIDTKSFKGRTACETAEKYGRVGIVAAFKAETLRRSRCETFALGTNPRLGAGSLILDLYPDVVQKILDEV